MRFPLGPILTVTLLVASAGHATAQLPLFVPSSMADAEAHLQPERTLKRVYRRAADETAQMGEAWEELRSEGEGSDRVFIRVQRREISGRMASDTVWFKAQDLAPIRRVSNGPDGSRWELDFRGTQVAAVRDGESVEFPETSGRDFFDSNILDYVCVELAVREAGAVAVPFFSEAEGTVVEYQIQVLGRESVEGSSEPVEAVRVDYTHPSGRTATVWVDVEQRRIVREGAAIGPDTEVYMVTERRE